MCILSFLPFILPFGKPMFIDTHCHLDDPALRSRLPQVLKDSRAAGVSSFVVPGVSPWGWGDIDAIAEPGQGIYPAFGLHPMHAALWNRDTERLLAHFAPRGVAVGEIGLDYLRADIPRTLQQEAFRGQLRLAARLGLPVLIHCRRAFEDLLAILDEEGVSEGIMHAFSGSVETARACIRRGFAISLCGTVTYRNARRPVEVARELPLESLILETDAPDIPPEVHRGGGNEPAFLQETALAVATIRNISLDELAAATTATASRILRIA